MEKKMIKYFSLFSGIGGFELGISKTVQCREESARGWMGISSDGVGSNSYGKSRENYTCIGFSEIDKYAIQVYKTHFNHKEYGNVSDINWSSTEDFNLFVGGFPCQAFSIAGNRRGFSDTRGTLFFEIAQCLREKQPRLLLLENVKGLLSHDKGKTFGVILNTLDELGYDLQWQVLNSKNFGVPQNRERVFIVGHLRGTRRPEVFPIGYKDSTDIKQPTTKIKGWLRQLSKYQGDYLHHENEICSTLSAYGRNNLKGIGLQIRDGRDNRSCLRSGRVPELGIPGSSIRRLTPTECERLQGFPDGWTKGVSDTQRYKCLGNAVTVNVIEAIVTKLTR